MGSSPVPIPPGVLFLPTARVHEIVGWSGEHLNGVQVVYDIEGVLVPGPKHLGEHDLYRQSSIVLDVNAGEVRQIMSSLQDCPGGEQVAYEKTRH